MLANTTPDAAAMTPLTRRSSIAGLSGGALGLAALTRSASAQSATPAAAGSHPMIGTCIVDGDVTDPTAAPSIVVYTADGGLIDPSQGVAGHWEATGPRAAARTLVVFLPAGAAGYIAVRSEGEFGDDDDTLDAPWPLTIVSADGTVLDAAEGMSLDQRLVLEPMTALGTPLAGMPTRELPPPAATPTP